MGDAFSVPFILSRYFSNFFFSESTLFYNFLEWQFQCLYLKRIKKKNTEKDVNLYYSLGLLRISIICHSIVCQAQELPWLLLRNRSTTSFRFMYVVCIRASEESLSCAANTTFWPQKRPDILSYPQRQSATQKRYNANLHLLQEKKDPRSYPCKNGCHAAALG